MMREIHVSWPVLCKTHIQDARDKLGRVRECVTHLGEKHSLAAAVENAVRAAEEAEKRLDETFGPDRRSG